MALMELAVWKELFKETWMGKGTVAVTSFVSIIQFYAILYMFPISVLLGTA